MNILNELLKHSSDATCCRILEDYLLEQGEELTIFNPVPLLNSGSGGGGGDGYGYGGGGSGDGGGYGYGGGGDGSGDGYIKIKTLPHVVIKKGEYSMHNGLAIVSVPSGGYYPYTLVAWLRHVEGNEWEAGGSRIIRRYGKDRSLAWLAANGPAEDTQLLEASEIPPPIHRLHMGRPEYCNESKWEKFMPKPKDWKGT